MIAHSDPEREAKRRNQIAMRYALRRVLRQQAIVAVFIRLGLTIGGLLVGLAIWYFFFR